MARDRSRYALADRFLGDMDAARTSYREETYARLVSLKNHYDPTNMFPLSHNIEPQAAGLRPTQRE